MYVIEIRKKSCLSQEHFQQKADHQKTCADVKNAAKGNVLHADEHCNAECDAALTGSQVYDGREEEQKGDPDFFRKRIFGENQFAKPENHSGYEKEHVRNGFFRKSESFCTEHQEEKHVVAELGNGNLEESGTYFGRNCLKHWGTSYKTIGCIALLSIVELSRKRYNFCYYSILWPLCETNEAFWNFLERSAMKILIVNKFLYPNGGSETYIFSIGSQLQKMGHEVQYFGMEHEGRIVGNHAESYTENMSFRDNAIGRRSLSGKISKLTYPFKIIYSTDARKKIRRVLEDFCPDVVHLNNINFQITPSVIDEIKAFDSHIRIVYTAHDPQWVCPNHMMRVPSTGELCSRCINGDVKWCTKFSCIHNSRAQSLIGTMEAEFYQRRGTYEKVDAIIAPSEFMNRTLSHNPQLAGRIVTLHNAFNVASENAADRALDHEFSEASYVLYFGRFSEEKGIRTLLKAVKALPEIPFVFAGKGELEGEINDLPNIRNEGFCESDKMMELIRGAAFTIFPSEWYENCPYSVIESQLAGTPVLASNLGGTPELLVLGVTGEFFEAGNVKELTEKIRALWNDNLKLKKYQDGCRKLAKKELPLTFDNLETYCRKLVMIYKNELF